MLIYPTAADARRESRIAARRYAENSRWGWEIVNERLMCKPHPKLPCLLDPSVARRQGGWVPCWVLIAGRDQPGWRFFQWVSARNDDTPPIPLDDAAEVVERTVDDYVFLVKRSMATPS